MYRMIIVDDEPAITDWLYQSVQAEFGNQLEVYRAYSGKECLNLMEKGNVRIVMTDISMPAFSGLDLLHYISRFYPETKKLVLSAYDNFQYAQKAISEKISAYILKEDGETAVFTAIGNVIGELDSETENHKFEPGNIDQSAVRLNMKRLEPLRRHVLGTIKYSELNSQVSPRWIDFNEPFSEIVISFEKSEDQIFDYMTIDDILFSVLHSFFSYELVAAEPEYMVIISQVKSSVSALNLIPSLYSSIEAMEERYHARSGKHLNILYDPDVKLENCPVAYDRMKNYLLDVRNYTAGLILSSEEAERNSRSSAGKDAVRNEISAVIDYIHSHLNEDLSLLQLSDKVFLNPSYLSYLFKNETGTNISDYIKHKKFEQSKSMLANPKYQIRDIAHAVGFDNASYFTRFFKKNSGVTPQAYRQNFIEQA